MQTVVVILLVIVALCSGNFPLPRLATQTRRSNTIQHQQPAIPVPPYDLICGYTNVDTVNDGNIFWWGYKNQLVEQKSGPIVIWLQGGPGASSNFGDLCEIGPVDACDGTPKPRNSTWLSLTHALLFIDNPVGTGFSYIRKSAGYAKDEKQIAQQLFQTLQNIYAKNPDFTGLPLYVFAESYGGKMASEFGAFLSDKLHNEPELAKLINFKGVGLGDSWVSPLDSVKSYGSFLRGISHFDTKYATESDSYAEKIETALKNKKYDEATELWGSQQYFYIGNTGINVYNFLRHDDDDLSGLAHYINTVMKKQFGIIPADVLWHMSSSEVFSFMSTDFMQNSTLAVEKLLNDGRTVVVFSGQLDVIVDTVSTEAWMNRLNWKGSKSWLETAQRSIRSNIVMNRPSYTYETNYAYRKVYQNLDYWRILYAGHMVPMDNPVMGYEMLKTVLSK